MARSGDIPERDPSLSHSDDGHSHSHGLVDPSILRSREGIKAVSISLAVLLVAALAQTAIFVLSGRVALLADLISQLRRRTDSDPTRHRVLFSALSGARSSLVLRSSSRS